VSATDADIDGALSQIEHGFRTLGFPVARDLINGARGVYAIKLDRGARDGNHPMDVQSDTWLRVQVFRQMNGALVASVDFLAGPQFWLQISKLIDGAGDP